MAVELSVSAGQALTELKKTGDLQEEDVVRLVPQEQGTFGLEVGPPQATDRVIEHEGAPMMAVSEAADASLGEAVLDVGNGEQEGAFVLRRKPSE